MELVFAAFGGFASAQDMILVFAACGGFCQHKIWNWFSLPVGVCVST
jgi:hypothetical protein